MTAICSVAAAEDQATSHQKLLDKCYQLSGQKRDAILAGHWAAKRRIDRESVSILKAAVQSRQGSPHLAVYQQMLAGSRTSLREEKVDVDYYKQKLHLGSMTQLRIAFEIHQQAIKETTRKTWGMS